MGWTLYLYGNQMSDEELETIALKTVSVSDGYAEARYVIITSQRC